MGNLEDIFKQTKGKIMGRTEGIQQDKEKELDKVIRMIESELTSELRKYRFSSRLQTAIDSEFTQLKESLLKMNNGQTSKMTENAIQSLDVLNRKINETEAELPENERETETKKSFSEVKATNEESKERNKEQKDKQYINECVEKSFENIKRNISSHINEAGVLALGLNSRGIQNIQQIKDDCCRKCKEQAGMVHDSSIDTISQMIDKEVENLETYISKEENQQSKETKPSLNNPFALPDDQKAEVNERIEKVTQETIEKNANKANRETMALPDNVLE